MKTVSFLDIDLSPVSFLNNVEEENTKAINSQAHPAISRNRMSQKQC